MLKAYLPKDVDPSKDLFISSLISDDNVKENKLFNII